MSIVIQRVLVSWSFLLLGAAPGLAQSAPSNFQATVRGPTVVDLRWDAVAATTGYHVFRAVGQGSFTRLTTFKISPTSYTDATATPSTTFQYRVAAVDAAGQTYYTPILTVTTPAPFQALTVTQVPVANLIGIAQPTPKATSGRYRISIAGFKVNHETYDDPLERDGKRDEVYVVMIVNRYNRKTGELLDSRIVRSKVYGDASGFPDRVPQGRASGKGGLMTGDVVPFGWDERSINPSAGPGAFPLILWEGVLANNEDALVLRPTIWEWDGDPKAFAYWLQVVTVDPAGNWNYGPLQQSLGDDVLRYVSGGQTVWDWGSQYSNLEAAFVIGGTSEQKLTPGRDRPIGLSPISYGVAWIDRLLPLTREKIESQLSRSSSGGQVPGLLPLHFVDDCPRCDAALSGNYTVYLRLERLP